MNEMLNTPLGSVSSTTTVSAAQRVVPLLAELQRTEELAAALAMRLDPITNHIPQEGQKEPVTPTVTRRINQLGDTLQYLLENIEL